MLEQNQGARNEWHLIDGEVLLRQDLVAVDREGLHLR